METLRILPPAYWIARISRAPFVLGGQEFPLGSTVLLSPFVTQRMADVYPNQIVSCRGVGSAYDISRMLLFHLRLAFVNVLANSIPSTFARQ